MTNKINPIKIGTTKKRKTITFKFFKKCVMVVFQRQSNVTEYRNLRKKAKVKMGAKASAALIALMMCDSNFLTLKAPKMFLIERKMYSNRIDYHSKIIR